MLSVWFILNQPISFRPNTTGELPLPESHFRSLGIGSRVTFWRWEKQGLRILKVGGRRFVYASDLTKFLERMNTRRGERVTLNQPAAVH